MAWTFMLVVYLGATFRLGHYSNFLTVSALVICLFFAIPNLFLSINYFINDLSIRMDASRNLIYRGKVVDYAQVHDGIKVIAKPGWRIDLSGYYYYLIAYKGGYIALSCFFIEKHGFTIDDLNVTVEKDTFPFIFLRS